MTSTVNTTAPVTTGLYIGGQERTTDDVLEVVDPARPGVVVGHAAAASKEDVADAVAAAKAAYPAWAALSATRCTTRAVASGAEGGGLTIAVLPASRACGSAAPRIAIGQLNGTMTVTTPSGW